MGLSVITIDSGVRRWPHFDDACRNLPIDAFRMNNRVVGKLLI